MIANPWKEGALKINSAQILALIVATGTIGYLRFKSDSFIASSSSGRSSGCCPASHQELPKNNKEETEINETIAKVITEILPLEIKKEEEAKKEILKPIEQEMVQIPVIHEQTIPSPIEPIETETVLLGRLDQVDPDFYGSGFNDWSVPRLSN